MRLAGTSAAAAPQRAAQGGAGVRCGGRLPGGRLIRRAPAGSRRRFGRRRAAGTRLAALLARIRLQLTEIAVGCMHACMEEIKACEICLSACADYEQQQRAGVREQEGAAAGLTGVLNRVVKATGKRSMNEHAKYGAGTLSKGAAPAR